MLIVPIGMIRHVVGGISLKLCCGAKLCEPATACRPSQLGLSCAEEQEARWSENKAERDRCGEPRGSSSLIISKQRFRIDKRVSEHVQERCRPDEKDGADTGAKMTRSTRCTMSRPWPKDGRIVA